MASLQSCVLGLLSRGITSVGKVVVHLIPPLEDLLHAVDEHVGTELEGSTTCPVHGFYILWVKRRARGQAS